MTEEIVYFRIRRTDADVNDVVTVRGHRGNYRIVKFRAEGKEINVWGGLSGKESMRTFLTSTITSAKRPVPPKKESDAKAISSRAAQTA